MLGEHTGDLFPMIRWEIGQNDVVGRGEMNFRLILRDDFAQRRLHPPAVPILDAARLDKQTEEEPPISLLMPAKGVALPLKLERHGFRKAEIHPALQLFPEQ